VRRCTHACQRQTRSPTTNGSSCDATQRREDRAPEEYVDEAASGAKERRPSIDRLLADARRRRFDVLVCWRLDRLGRNLKHLITLLDEFQALGIAFVSLAEGIHGRGI
jgi:DNA invertase Pin-like site-specific DNA recombinase